MTVFMRNRACVNFLHSEEREEKNEYHRVRLVTAHRVPPTVDDLKRSIWDFTSCQVRLLSWVGHDMYLCIGASRSDEHIYTHGVSLSQFDQTFIDNKNVY